MLAKRVRISQLHGIIETKISCITQSERQPNGDWNVKQYGLPVTRYEMHDSQGCRSQDFRDDPL